MDATKPDPIRCKACGYEVCKHPCSYCRCHSIRTTEFCGSPCRDAYNEEKVITIERAEQGKL